jgi:hypothetical protein
LHNRKLYLDALFFISVYLGLKCCLSFWMLLLFQFFLVISETLSCSLLLAITLRQLDVFQLLTLCANTLTSETHYFFKTNSALIHDIIISFCLNTLYWFSHHIVFALFSVLFFCICCLFYLYPVYCPLLIGVCVLCCFCNWPFGCGLSILINKN